MANIDVFFKYDGKILSFCNEENGAYAIVDALTVTAKPHDDDTITFHGGEGIKKLIQIKDGQQGSVKLFKTQHQPSDNTIIATMVSKSKKGDLDKYDVKFKSENGGKTITIDPQIQSQNGG